MMIDEWMNGLAKAVLFKGDQLEERDEESKSCQLQGEDSFTSRKCHSNLLTHAACLCGMIERQTSGLNLKSLKVKEDSCNL